MREVTDPEAVVKLENAANRALRALELGRHQPAGQSLSDYLAARNAARPAASGPA
jgi:hypothetical protein